MKKLLLPLILIAHPAFAENKNTIINNMDFGPLAALVGTWKSDDTGGVDVAPGQEGSQVGKGAHAIEPFYEVMTFEPVADAKNASDQYLVAMYYKQEAFRKSDDGKFHDQRGYLIYDKENNKIYNTYCIPRAVCVVAEGDASDKIEFKLSERGIAESSYMTQNDKTTDFSMTLDMSQDGHLKYDQVITLNVYGKPFTHTDSSSLVRAETPADKDRLSNR